MTTTSWFRRWRRRFRGLVRPTAMDRELDEELAFHLKMETTHNLRAGMAPDEARRQAQLAFGSVGKHRGATRDGRWLGWVPDLSLDFRVGARMLAKFPGITAIGTLAMAFGIWAGCITFELVSMLLFPSLPLPQGDRIVQVVSWNARQSRVESRLSYDFAEWRRSLRSLEELGAYRDRTVNLIVRAGDSRPMALAEMSASGFRLAAGVPLMGRMLDENDQRAGAPPVIVLGQELWRARFAGDPTVIGRSVQVGDAFATVVGIMPDAFRFPVSHDAWMPLRADQLDHEPVSGAELHVFARLGDGIALEEAQAELSTVTAGRAAMHPDRYADLQFRVLPYTSSFPEMNAADRSIAMTIPMFAVMLLVLVCSNVALLLFARAATREGELLVRSALGATRGRLVAQLCAEALVLGLLAAVVGLFAADLTLGVWGTPFLKANMGRLPFWYDVGLSPLTIAYALALTLLAAAIAGVLPALKATRGMANRLRALGAGAGGLRFGGIWTAVIVTQVAFTTAFPALLYVEQQELRRIESLDAGFPAHEYLSAQLAFDSTDLGVAATAAAEPSSRYVSALERLRDRLSAEPGVKGVTFVDRLPRTPHVERRIELDSFGATDDMNAAERAPRSVVSTAAVDRSYFDVLHAPVLEGRALTTADMHAQAGVVVVDQGFVSEVLGGRAAVGRRLRFVRRAQPNEEVVPPEPWLEIVGVVKNLGMQAGTQRGQAAGVYLPSVAGRDGVVNVMVHVDGDPMHFVPRLRAIAAQADARLQLTEMQRVDEVADEIIWIIGLWLRLTLALTVIALVLSLAGIYAIMSFTVSRRTREIGIRVALGARAGELIVSIFRRPLQQVAFGVACGGAIAGAFVVFTQSCQDGQCVESGLVTPQAGVMLAGYATIIFAVCMLACILPTRRALAIEPTEALRAD